MCWLCQWMTTSCSEHFTSYCGLLGWSDNCASVHYFFSLWFFHCAGYPHRHICWRIGNGARDTWLVSLIVSTSGVRKLRNAPLWLFRKASWWAYSHSWTESAARIERTHSMALGRAQEQNTRLQQQKNPACVALSLSLSSCSTQRRHQIGRHTE